MDFPLSRNILIALLGILLLAVVSSGVALFSAWQSEQVFRDLISRNTEQAGTIYELEIALLEQGVFTSLYLMGGDPERLAELRRRTPDFGAWLSKTEKMGLEADEQEFIEQMGQAFAEYEVKVQEVIALHTDGHAEQAKQRWLAEASAPYDRIYRLCESLSAANARDIEQAVVARGAQVKRVNLWVAVFLSVLTGLLAGLSVSLSRGVFRPLHHLVDSLGPQRPPLLSGSSGEEIRSLGVFIDSLRDEVAEMRSRLSLSQRRLLDAEKLASVGKLAASVAHEIRSPLTALRLRVFSVQKALGDQYRQKDFELISEEITRLDNIVGDFLEFARPRKLTLETCDVRLLLDKTVELVSYRLEAAHITLECQYDQNLPKVRADSQRLKQVFVNLLNNAMEALRDGGTVQITAQAEQKSDGNSIVQILVHDSGRGIAPEVQDCMFDPFFGTKADGTGLGLWIAKRIMTEHHGDIELAESTASGTTFSLWLPVAGEESDE